jgi:lipid-binding SYLF domain-containing protein
MRPDLPRRALLLLALTLLPASAALAQSREEARLITATQVLEQLHASPDQNIPAWLLDRAYGVAVIPDVIKGAFMFGGRHGSGAFVARDSAGRFSNPVFMSLTGGSWGLQIGAQSTDIVLIFASRKSVDEFARGDFTLGVGGSVAAGPVGRSGEAAAGITSEVYSYSRNRGLFAGIQLDGTALVFDRKANRNFYGHDVTTDDILGAHVTTNSESARRFIAAIVAGMSPAGATGAGASASGAAAVATPAPAATPAAGATPPPAAPAASPPKNEGAQSFPLADPKPGSEPH